MIQLPARGSFDILCDALRDSLVSIWGLSEEEALQIIRINDQTDVGSVKQDLDPQKLYCYIAPAGVDKVGNGVIQKRYLDLDPQADTIKLEQWMHAGKRVRYVVYGQQAPDLANILYMGIHEGDARSVLREAGIVAIPHGPMPITLPELIDGAWFQRADLSIDFDTVVSYQSDIGTIEVAPDIHITKGE